MPSYTYRARDQAGKLVTGTMEAPSAEALTAKLGKMGYMTTSVAPVKPGIRLGSISEMLAPVKVQDLVVFNFQLANMLESGISILVALAAIEVQLENKKLKGIIGDVLRNIEAGGSFSASLNNHPGVFSKLYISMVKAGEESGRLNEVLKRYANFCEGQLELREKVQGALFYPAILFIASVSIIVFIVTFIIPQFVGLFSKAGIKLPLSTRILFVIGLIIKRYWYAIIIGLAALLFGMKQYRVSERGKIHFDRLLLKIPVVGVLVRKIYVSRFSRTLATLLSSGVPILRSLDIAREVIGNAVIAEAIVNVRESVEHGQKISEPLKISAEFPSDAVQMIAAGEETGNLEGMLNKTADFYDMAAGYGIKKLTALIEPLFLVIMGSIVGFIMAAMLLPIFDMAKILRR